MLEGFRNEDLWGVTTLKVSLLVSKTKTDTENIF